MKKMKKIISLTLAFLLMISSFAFVSAQDEEIKVYLEGRKVTFDVQPQTVNNRTMVPIRAIFEAMGATVEWDETTKTATSTTADTTVKMTLNSTTEYINGQAFEMDVTPVIINNRTLAPARYVAEAFGYYVNWDAMTKSVLISKDADFDISQIKDGTRKHPYKFGDTVQISVYKIMSDKPKAIYNITPKSVLSPAEMEEKINNSSYYKYSEDTWYLNCDVSLSYYEEDSAYSFSDMLLVDSNFVTNNGTTLSVYSWYRDPSTYKYLELYEEGSGECYLPIKKSELTEGETVDYFTITTYLASEKYSADKTTVWFSVKQ